MSCGRIVSLTDSFGIPVAFTLGRRRLFKSELGGCLTISFLCLLIPMFIINLDDLTSREKMNMKYSEIIEEEAPEIDFKTNNLAMGVAIESRKEGFESFLPYFKVEVENVAVLNTGTHVTALKSDTDCKEAFVSTNQAYKIDQNNLNCLPSSKFAVRGDENSSHFSFVRVRISIDYGKIKNLLEFSKEMRKYYPFVSFLFYDMQAEMNIYLNPIKKRLNRLISPIDMHFSNTLELLFAKNSLYSDDALFFESGKTEEYYSFDKYTQSYFFNGMNENELKDKHLLEFTISSENQVGVSKRIYYKVPEYLADNGAIFSEAYIILMILMNYVNYLQSIIKAISHIYYFNMPKDVAKHFKKEASRVVKLIEKKDISSPMKTMRSFSSKDGDGLNRGCVR